tara:strand:- start:1690 stop:2511 length:822 start_codon:yes stop_codon:yes gene_type:complete
MMNKLLKLYRAHFLLRWFWWLAVIIPGVPFILFSVVFQLYAHWPRDYSDIKIGAINPNTQYLSFSAHGVKDSPESWSNELQNLIKQSNNEQLTNLTKAQISLNWQPYSDNALVCSVTGSNIGHKLAKKIALLPNLKAVHLVGHSCGSFVIYGLCEKLKQINPTIKVQTTYLDPVSIYSGIFWHYGVDNFGDCADFSDSYIDTKDGVPGSNEKLKNAYTFDVTNIRLEQNLPYAPHAWPTHFYLDAYKNKQVPLYFNFPSGLDKRFDKNKLIKW